MARSWDEIPHVTHCDYADITELERFRQAHKEAVEQRGGALTLTAFLIKASAAALKKFPRFNASLDLENEEIVLKKHYHIGAAVDTDQGLLVPVIRNADQKSLTELAVEFKNLARRTREGKAEVEDMRGGTFTITNVGPLGGTNFTPIINHPQAAILGAARAELRPTVQGTLDEWNIEPRLILPLSLGFDHRLVDGAEAARFLGFIIDALKTPENLLMVL
jgi:pyruvate dehydrogenase E2 component (dihydrolipoamide acetyltransferase)